MPDEGTTRLSKAGLIVVDVGNTSTALGVWDGTNVSHSTRVPTTDRNRFAETYEALCRCFDGGRPAAMTVASVVPDVTAWLRSYLGEVLSHKMTVVGQDIPLPIPVAVREPGLLGVDRVCSAAAAFERTQHACTVIDFGTAITVDLVDDEGTFVGGAILPGPTLQARSLARDTAALPEVEVVAPQDAIGRDTVEAIRSGIHYGIPGAVRGIVEQYATQLNQWPQVVATGGELESLLERCDFIDTPVPDLTLLGVGLAAARHAQKLKVS